MRERAQLFAAGAWSVKSSCPFIAKCCEKSKSLSSVSDVVWFELELDVEPLTDESDETHVADRAKEANACSHGDNDLGERDFAILQPMKEVANSHESFGDWPVCEHDQSGGDPEVGDARRVVT